MLEDLFITNNQQFFHKIETDIKKHSDKYHEAGKWLNRYYDDEELYQKRRKYELITLIDRIKRKAKPSEIDLMDLKDVTGSMQLIGAEKIITWRKAQLRKRNLLIGAAAAGLLFPFTFLILFVRKQIKRKRNMAQSHCPTELPNEQKKQDKAAGS